MTSIRLRPGLVTPHSDDPAVVYTDHPDTSRLKDEVLELIPDCHLIVEESVTRWKQKARNRLREQLRVQMYFDDEQARVPVEAIDGKPKELLEILRDPDFRRIDARLRMQRGNIETAASTLSWLTAQRNLALLPGECQPFPTEALNQSRQWLMLLNDLLRHSANRLIEVLVNPDVLGTYWPRDQLITIHWLPIGLLAIEANQSVHDIVPIVLFHEYAHAYHHLGFDSDGNQFAVDSFVGSETDFKEGIAQYYTYQLIHSYNDVGDGVRRVWDYMQTRSSATYRLRENWLVDSDPVTGQKEKKRAREKEIIRLAVMKTRKQGHDGVTLAEFEQAIESARNELRAMD